MATTIIIHQFSVLKHCKIKLQTLSSQKTKKPLQKVGVNRQENMNASEAQISSSFYFYSCIWKTLGSLSKDNGNGNDDARKQ